jgi:hypothetical protein
MDDVLMARWAASQQRVVAGGLCLNAVANLRTGVPCELSKPEPSALAMDPQGLEIMAAPDLSPLSQPGGRILGWSRQDRQLYWENFGDVYHLRFPQDHQPQLVNLNDIQRGTGILGFMSWVVLGPDDSVLLVRETSNEELYAIRWDAP